MPIPRSKENSLEVVYRLAGGRARSRALHNVYPVARTGACRIAPAALDDHAAGLAGARTDV